ncbi:MAG: DUF3307 domain-containing protein [Bacillota bacterium]
MWDFVFRLVLAHFLADFALQFDGLYRLKQRGHLGLAAHSAVVLACSLALARPYLAPVSVGLVAGLTATHYCLDYLKNNWRRYPAALAGFLLDQVAHLGVILLVALLWAQSEGAGRGAPAWVILAPGLIAATQFMSFVTYYLDRSGQGYPAPYRRRYAALALQLVAYAAAAGAVLGSRPLWLSASAAAAAVQFATGRNAGPQGLTARWAGPLGAVLLGAGAAMLARLGA